MRSKGKAPGKVYLVGAGPGDPRLLTLRGAEVLRRAEVVIHDALVSPELVRLAPPGAEIIGRTAAQPFTQAELNRLLRSRAQAGKLVVRLKGGDPFVFGRGGEEAEALTAAGIAFEVVPGVSAVTAVPVSAGIPITHRTLASTLTVVTGHEDPVKAAPGVDWSLVARTPGTKIILMGLERLERIAATLIRHGQSAATPTAVTQWGTTGQQRTVVGVLGDITDRVARAGMGSPAVITVGEVVGLRQALNWCEGRSLFGQRIVVTRAREQAEELGGLLRERGADVIEVPCLRFVAPTALEPLAEALAGLGSYEWVVFTSANGVTTFFERLFQAYEDVRALGIVRLAAVGPGTAARLRDLHLKVDLVPEDYTATGVAAALATTESLENLRILLPRAEHANPELPRLLESRGAIVDDIPCYRTEVEREDWNGGAARFGAEGADWVTFASGSAVRHFHERFDLGQVRAKHPGLRWASIGPETSRVLSGLGVEPDVEARPHTMLGLAEAVERAVGSRPTRVSGEASGSPRVSGSGG